jgi:Fe-S cluster assembly protein SufD
MKNIIEHSKDLKTNNQLIIKSQTEAFYILIVDGEVTTTKEIILESGATLHTYYLFLNNKSELNFKHTINEDAKIIAHALVLSESELKVKAEYNFVGSSSFGAIKADAVLSGAANLKYDAILRVKPEAQQSDTRVDMRLYLNSPEARGQLTPQLEVAANDVKAGHSASTFKLSSDDLFYLQSRGLSPAQIKALQLKSLSNIFVQGLDLETSKTVLDLIATQI